MLLMWHGSLWVSGFGALLLLAGACEGATGVASHADGMGEDAVVGPESRVAAPGSDGSGPAQLNPDAGVGQLSGADASLEPPIGDSPDAGVELSEPLPGPGGLSACRDRDDLLFCEDFEGGTLDTRTWAVIEENGAAVTVSTEQAVQGTYALRVRVANQAGTTGFIQSGEPFPIAGNHIFGRAYVYLASDVPYSHNRLMETSGTLDGSRARFTLDLGRSGQLNSRYNHRSIDVHGGLKKVGFPIPREEWLCIEWEYDGQNNEVRWWMDGAAVDEMTVQRTEDPPWVAPTFAEVKLGLRSIQEPTNGTSFELFWDAYALSSSRIGCERE